MTALPQRIVCLTPETVDVLYRLGEQHRIAGISGFTVRPSQARREKPRVSAYTTAHVERVLALQPDLVLAFSDMQADIVAELVRAGLPVHVFNQRGLEGILAMVTTVGALVGAPDKAQALVDALMARLDLARLAAAEIKPRPQVYFEEWNDPLICGIRWVSELIELAGGEDAFADLARSPGAAGRILADPAEVIRRAPDLIIGSWCGKRFRPEHIRTRPGWSGVPAVRDNELYEIKSADILQPGPAVFDVALPRLQALIADWARRQARIAS